MGKRFFFAYSAWFANQNPNGIGFSLFLYMIQFLFFDILSRLRSADQVLCQGFLPPPIWPPPTYDF